MAAFAAQFTEDTDFVNVLGLHLRGRPAIEAQHVAIHQIVFRSSQLQRLDQTIRSLTSEVAVAHVNWQMTGHETGPVKQWQPEVRRGILTAVLPEGDTWRITTLHNTDTLAVPGLGK